MCGILACINYKKNIPASALEKATAIIRHRGPDDEGFMLWSPDNVSKVYSGTDSDKASVEFHDLKTLPNTTEWLVGFGHRRLSILDLSPLGHQPMVDTKTGITISYNGEIFNYIEIRNELISLGHVFKSSGDTEVILKAWIEWGPDCLNKFNGMFGIVILDPCDGGKLYAVRDRFGVKPLYWTKTENYFAFASEIKQLRVLPDFSKNLNHNIVYDYLVYGQLDHTAQTFDKNIEQLRGGQIMIIDLSSFQYTIKSWYTLPDKRWIGTEKQAIDQFEELLTDAVRLRLRSDVPVGSCLSGGLDSSAIVCLMEKILRIQSHNGIKTVTACFDNKKYDEWDYAEAVVKQTGAKAYKVFPSFENLQDSLEKLLWHMDEPFGSTSQYSQWCVFKGAADAGLKVMLDGQGSDEQLAGYNGNDQPLYAGLLNRYKFKEMFQEANAYKRMNGYYPKAQVLKAFRTTWPAIDIFLPSSLKKAESTYMPAWLNLPHKSMEGDFNNPLSLRDTLINQTLHTSLPVLLRYEDRNSMACSIESRVPFMDYRFIEFTLNLPEKMVYRRGIKKYILREAMKNTFPPKIYERRDKMGFVTPEEVWLKGDGKDWFIQSIEQSGRFLPELINVSKVKNQITHLIGGELKFDFSYWRLACMGNWLK